MIIPVKTEQGGYDIVIEKDCTKRADEYLLLQRKVLIVTDDGVPAEYARRVASLCKEPEIVCIRSGEGSKSTETWQQLLSVMLKKGFTRKDCAVAVGGGVVGDLTGFAAASYMRGIDFYNIPTTVLSQVDSSIGGKTAVNFMGIKNIVGAFYQPKKVLIDTELLKTLPQRQISNGLAEALKMSLTSDAELFDIFENKDVFANLQTVIERSLMIKKKVVEEDEKESGVRKILNFGHTVGHGIESLGSLYHGECVALGMLPMCSDEVRARLLPVLAKLKLPTGISFNAGDVYKAALHDKKSTKDGVTAVTVEKIGTYKLTDISFEELRKRIDYFGSDLK